jgi:hypothetical protein
MERYGLEYEDRQLILTGDLRELKERLGQEVSAQPYVIVRFVLLFSSDSPEQSGEEQSGA